LGENEGGEKGGRETYELVLDGNDDPDEGCNDNDESCKGLVEPVHPDFLQYPQPYDAQWEQQRKAAQHQQPVEGPSQMGFIRCAFTSVDRGGLVERGNGDASNSSRLKHVQRELIVVSVLRDLCIQIVALHILHSSVGARKHGHDEGLFGACHIDLIARPLPAVLALGIDDDAPEFSLFDLGACKDRDRHVFHRIVLRLGMSRCEPGTDGHVLPVRTPIGNEDQGRIRHGLPQAKGNPGLLVRSRHVEKEVTAVTAGDIDSDSEVDASANGIVHEDGGWRISRECSGDESWGLQ
jgi:hypothetical protein